MRRIALFYIFANLLIEKTCFKKLAWWLVNRSERMGLTGDINPGVQTSSYRSVSSGDLICSIVLIVNNTELHT